MLKQRIQGIQGHIDPSHRILCIYTQNRISEGYTVNTQGIQGIGSHTRDIRQDPYGDTHNHRLRGIYKAYTRDTRYIESHVKDAKHKVLCIHTKQNIRGTFRAYTRETRHKVTYKGYKAKSIYTESHGLKGINKIYIRDTRYIGSHTREQGIESHAYTDRDTSKRHIHGLNKRYKA